LVAGYLEGRTIAALAEQFGVHKKTVSAHLQRAGVPRRYRLLGDAEVMEAVGLYATGWSLARLEARYEVQPNTVRRALRAAGVATRPRPGR
jgi:lambda repressor-like predicted transcriptional regulator